jgi:hypothetical protein
MLSTADIISKSVTKTADCVGDNVTTKYVRMNIHGDYSVCHDLNHWANSNKPTAVIRNKPAGTDDSTSRCLSENKD